MSRKLENKVSVITGAGSGIGKSIAMRFAREGAMVYLLEINHETGLNVEETINKNGGKSRFIQCDVADEKSVKESFNTLLQENSRVDILVNNAGVSHIGSIENTTSSDMDRLYQINVKSIYLVTREIIGTMVANQQGNILNMASIASKIGLNDRFAYSMSKGAVLSMTMSIAQDYIEKNIRCNCLCPARVHTPFVDDFLQKNYPGKEKEMFESLSKYQPIGRMGTPDEIANLALFLCSDESSFITGQAYDIDGGVMNLR
jgi:NAD(P)-dependent dehydrogenase (short-subunit alcohol dehydrogenase family)